MARQQEFKFMVAYFVGVFFPFFV